jgi:hypothetical protein
LPPAGSQQAVSLLGKPCSKMRVRNLFSMIRCYTSDILYFEKRIQQKIIHLLNVVDLPASNRPCALTEISEYMLERKNTIVKTEMHRSTQLNTNRLGHDVVIMGYCLSCPAKNHLFKTTIKKCRSKMSFIDETDGQFCGDLSKEESWNIYSIFV